VIFSTNKFSIGSNFVVFDLFLSGNKRCMYLFENISYAVDENCHCEFSEEKIICPYQRKGQDLFNYFSWANIQLQHTKNNPRADEQRYGGRTSDSLSGY
jgi:hypothetical protein